MLMVRWNPFGVIGALADEPAFVRLPLNIAQRDGKYVITAPMAGFKPEEVEVNLADGVLTISARHGEEKKTERKGYLRREVVSANVYRQIPVGDIDPSSVSAQLENGVLTVTLPAPTKPEPVRIAINGRSAANALEAGRAEQPAAKSA